MSEFVHLHNHTDMSLLDGAQTVEQLVSVIKEQGMKAVAVTEHGNLFSAIKFFREARKWGIKPIIGCEVYVAEKSRFDKTARALGGRPYYHFVLLAHNREGYRNLIKLVSLGYLEGFYHRPRVDKELLREYSSGLIALSGCLKGEIPQALLKGNEKEALAAAREWQSIFPDRFFIEIQNHHLKEELTVLPMLIDLARRLDIPIVATNDAHYARKEHADAHDVLLCIGKGKKVEETDRMKYETTELYLRTPSEMEGLFAETPDALSNTAVIAEMCDLEIEMGKNHLPFFPIPEDKKQNSPDEYLKLLVEQGLENRYKEISEEIRERAQFELDTIRKMGFAGYFLIVQDFVKYARENDIPVGPGRGSAAGSLVAYALGITNVDPLRYNLLFERFLNPDRVSMPDIDIDFCFERRQEVIDYIKKRYGEESVSQIITFGTLKARAVVRDVGRVLGMSYGEVDRIAKMIPEGPKMTLKDALEQNPELREAQNLDETHKKLIDYSLVLEGFSRHAGTHAAGVVIAPGNLMDYVPLYQAPGADATTQFDMKSLDHVGLLKVDFLGLRTLTVIDKTVKMLREKGIEVDIENIPLDDETTFRLFSEGQTIGVFQFESAGMRKYLQQLKPSRVEDLIAMNALYRPGPMRMIDEFIQRKHDTKKIAYLHPDMEPILKDTYGIIVYQEQVMQIANRLAGFSLAKADEMRKAMGKKLQDKMAQLKTDFIEGAVNNGLKKTLASKIWDLIVEFASYGFNKSHSTAYALLAYQTAYLKAHYPGEFMAANLTSEIQDPKRIVILANEVTKMGMKILPPDVNSSNVQFTYAEGKIRYGLAAIKNVGLKAAESIVRKREDEGTYRSLFDFCARVDLRSVNHKTIESLILSGAMDSLPGNRASKMSVLDKAIQYGQHYQAEKNNIQTSLFDLQPESANSVISEPTLMEIAEFPDSRRWADEKELLGLYVSGHPLLQYQEEIKIFSNIDFTDERLKNDEINWQLRIGGIITKVRKIFAKNGKMMAFFSLESLEGTLEIISFTDTFEQFRHLISVDNKVFLLGRQTARRDEDTPSLIVEDMFPLEETRERLTRRVHLRLEVDQMNPEDVDRLHAFINSNPGNCELLFHIFDKNGNGRLIKSLSFKVSSDAAFIGKLRKTYGDKNIWFN